MKVTCHVEFDIKWNLWGFMPQSFCQTTCKNSVNECQVSPFLTSYYMLFLSFSDELSSILKKLSLEKYQPIFEEQEVFFILCRKGIPNHFIQSNKKSFFPLFLTLFLHFQSWVFNMKDHWTAVPERAYIKLRKRYIFLIYCMCSVQCFNPSFSCFFF